MSDLRYNYEQNEQHLEAVKQLSQELEGILDQISSDVSQLQGAWEGAGAESWANTQSSWDTKAQNEKAALDKLQAAASQANSDMRDLDNEIANSF
ncbi:WXG100 family type VII secretion target [Segniliparus rugosus]|uniref:ESAT-6-like protein n=1 Tax=Segniliparus rugosus (strain ATCC BAA-974 / DSM 45345 / CCUG 50838 / CIP 108380 / JCM 13579 / CDC 945) TaxID=679197 RepID=E5XKR9_SEGRC|nr:WXG100 family type VII secretion target [Segniliparus rugosus]EFV15062.1 WXG100 family type VII secretion target [Segniliparus rugosus ATCC BAA-974]